ncbi:hypothetical protein LPJ79_003274 [Coemansia sp. RSA 1821]|nr:hypothetical protein LPJ79_003274 [Coemansia sp. RSA 1821]
MPPPPKPTEKELAVLRKKKATMVNMFKNGVLVVVHTDEQAYVAEKVGARGIIVGNDKRKDVDNKTYIAAASMTTVKDVLGAVFLPVFGRIRQCHRVEAQMMSACGVNGIDEFEGMAATGNDLMPREAYKVPFIKGVKNLKEAFEAIHRGASMLRTACGVEEDVYKIHEAATILRTIDEEIQTIATKTDDPTLKKIKEYKESTSESLVDQVIKNKKLPVPILADGGIMKPMDAAMMMRLKADGIVASAQVFRTTEPDRRIRSLVLATAHHKDAKKLASICEAHESFGPKTRSAMATSSKILVSAPWLHENLKRVKVLDCSWYLPFLNRDPKEEFINGHIPGAQFFDIDGIKDETKHDLPHMLPSPQIFGASMDKFGITNDDHVVVYDTAGVGPSCRVFWTFRAMGHKQVSVLNGGMPAWGMHNYRTESDSPSVSPSHPSHQYTAHPIPELVCDYTQLVKNIGLLKSSAGAEGKQIVDARPNDRFTGKAPEFRPGLSSGHMPYALNVPFTDMTTPVDSKHPQVAVLKKPEEIRQIFASAGMDFYRPVITTCGSGITAAVLYVALLHAGIDEHSLALYDGSWAEYALNPHSEISKD